MHNLARHVLLSRVLLPHRSSSLFHASTSGQPSLCWPHSHRASFPEYHHLTHTFPRSAVMASTTAKPIIRAAAGPCPDTGCNSARAGPSALPKGFPRRVQNKSAWNGPALAPNESDYIMTLTDSHIQLLEAALSFFKGLGLDGGQVTREVFPLPGLDKRLDQVSQDIHSGRGFGLVRGLDPKKYSVEDLTLLHLGIQSHIADTQGRQDKKGNMLVHIVADNSTAQKANHHRHSTAPITFHNEEAGDIVCWITRSTAASGGKCIIAAGHTIYNVLAATRPDIIRLLARSDWPFAFPRFHCRPILFHHEGNVIINFGRTPLTGSAAHPRDPSLPQLSASQLEALDAIEAIAKATQLEIATQAGDIHFINNLTILHRREGFVDGSDATQKRHLVRMLLRDSKQGWAIPKELQREWFEAFEKDADQVWHLEPMPEGFFPLRINTN